MKVILSQDIAGIGKKSEIKNVSDGYAKNFLLPKGLAQIATEETIKNIQQQKASEESLKKKIKKEIEDFISKIDQETFHFYPKIGTKKEVFGSITKRDIEEEILKKFPIKFRKKIKLTVELDKPLKTLGEHEVEINFGFGAKKKISVVLNQALIISK